MNKVFNLLCSLLITFSVTAGVSADVLVYDEGGYSTPTTPDPWWTIASYSPIDMRHGAYYVVGLQDWMLGPEINIVFNGIYDDLHGDNVLSVYLFDDPVDNPLSPGWHYAGEDGYSLLVPDWIGGYNATLVGQWTDVDGNQTANDVVFTLSSQDDPELWANLVNGGNFGIGIDPDCHFRGDSIEIETPVPEPTTMLLFGCGLIGMGVLGRKKILRGHTSQSVMSFPKGTKMLLDN